MSLILEFISEYNKIIIIGLAFAAAVIVSKDIARMTNSYYRKSRRLEQYIQKLEKELDLLREYHYEKQHGSKSIHPSFNINLSEVLQHLEAKWGDNLGDGIALQILDQNCDEMYTLDCKTEIEAAWDYEAFRNSLNKVIEIEYLDDYYNDQFENEEDEVIKSGIRITINVGGNNEKTN